MNIREMHYDIKMKLNKIDTQQYRNLFVPEIDWLINSAIEVFVKMTMNPRYNPIQGFEKTQRDRDDLRSLIINNYILHPNTSSTLKEYVYNLPADYMYYVSANVTMNNSNCGLRNGRLMIRQHDDRFEESPFDKSSYEWGEVNAVFFEEGLKLFTDETFTLEDLYLNYLRVHPYVHNAQDFTGGSYTNLQGDVLTLYQDCILPQHTHSEIVDIAVLLASMSLQMPDIQVKLNKLKLT